MALRLALSAKNIVSVLKNIHVWAPTFFGRIVLEPAAYK